MLKSTDFKYNSIKILLYNFALQLHYVSLSNEYPIMYDICRSLRQLLQQCSITSNATVLIICFDS